MTSPTTPAGARDPIDSLQERVTALHQQMSRATTTTAVVGIVAVILLTIYFNYAYNQIVDLTKPQSLVMHADQVLVDNLTTTREALQKQITESAPEWASELNRQAIASVPELRKGVESFIVAQLDEQLKEADLIGDDEFRQLLKEHKEELRAHAMLLASNDKLPEESMKDFVRMYDEHFQVNFKETTDTLFEGLFNMNKNLLRLKANQGLTEEERQQRRLIMLARAIQGKKLTSDKHAMTRSPQGE